MTTEAPEAHQHDICGSPDPHQHGHSGEVWAGSPSVPPPHAVPFRARPAWEDPLHINSGLNHRSLTYLCAENPDPDRNGLAHTLYQALKKHHKPKSKDTVDAPSTLDHDQDCLCIRYLEISRQTLKHHPRRNLIFWLVARLLSLVLSFLRTKYQNGTGCHGCNQTATRPPNQHD